MVKRNDKELPESKFEIIKGIQARGMRVKEELRTGKNIYLKVKSRKKPNFLSLTFILCISTAGGTEITPFYELNWTRFLLNAGIFIGSIFMLFILTFLLFQESLLEGFCLMIISSLLVLGLYQKLIYFSNEDLIDLGEVDPI